MATVAKSINWNSAVWNQAVDAVAAMGGWTATIPDPDTTKPGGSTLPNPVGKIQFFNKWLKAQAVNAINENNNRAAVQTVVDTEE